jgi:hypothetical protein
LCDEQLALDVEMMPRLIISPKIMKAPIASIVEAVLILNLKVIAGETRRTHRTTGSQKATERAFFYVLGAKTGDARITV